MTIGILCTVVLGAVALWQAVMAATYRRIAVEALADVRVTEATWRGAYEAQKLEMRVANARHGVFVEGLKRCQWPHVRHDARAMHQAIHDAAVAANRAAEEARTSEEKS